VRQNLGTATTRARDYSDKTYADSLTGGTVAPGIHAATSKTTPVDADELALVDSEASFGLKKLTWSALKAMLATWLQTLTANWSNKTLTNATFTNYTESVVAIGTVTTAATLSLTNGTVQTATLAASTACVFTMPTAVAGKSFVLYLKQATTTGGGSATFTGVKWPGTAPTITATAGKMDILSFVSDGASWYGSYAQGYTP
jgi:hypothetical protein